MYKNIIVPAIISGGAFVLLIVTSIVGGFLPLRLAIAARVLTLALFLIFAFALVPVAIWAVLRGNISLWEKTPLTGTGLLVNLRNYITQNETRVFYGLLAFVWGAFALGLVVAIPAMIKEGFFRELFTITK